jgi:hypothetical protein
VPRTVITVRIRIGQTVDVPDAGSPTESWAATIGDVRVERADPVVAIGQAFSEVLPTMIRPLVEG